MPPILQQMETKPMRFAERAALIALLAADRKSVV